MLEWTEDSLRVASRQEVLFPRSGLFKEGSQGKGWCWADRALLSGLEPKQLCFVLSHTEFFHETFCEERSFYSQKTRRQTAQLHGLTLLLSSSVTLSNSLTSLCLSFFISKIQIIVLLMINDSINNK